MEDQIITIFLTTPEAILFRDFQKYHDLFQILQKNGVFDLKFGHCVLNFAGGELQNVTKDEVIYRKSWLLFGDVK